MFYILQCSAWDQAWVHLYVNSLCKLTRPEIKIFEYDVSWKMKREKISLLKGSRRTWILRERLKWDICVVLALYLTPHFNEMLTENCTGLSLTKWTKDLKRNRRKALKEILPVGYFFLWTNWKRNENYCHICIIKN